MSDIMKIAIIGLGGIGSSFVSELADLLVKGIIKPVPSITLFDFDTVERKNLLYQDYKVNDLMKSKAEVLGKRHKMPYRNKKVEKPEELKDYDLIVVAGDNALVRKIVFETKKPFIDMRAESSGAAVFTTATPTFLQSIKTNGESTSCQLPYEFSQGKVQQGFRIASAIGIQCLLNHIRNDKNPEEIILRV